MSISYDSGRLLWLSSCNPVSHIRVMCWLAKELQAELMVASSMIFPWSPWNLPAIISFHFLYFSTTQDLLDARYYVTLYNIGNPFFLLSIAQTIDSFESDFYIYPCHVVSGYITVNDMHVASVGPLSDTPYIAWILLDISRGISSSFAYSPSIIAFTFPCGFECLV